MKITFSYLTGSGSCIKWPDKPGNCQMWRVDTLRQGFSVKLNCKVIPVLGWVDMGSTLPGKVQRILWIPGIVECFMRGWAHWIDPRFYKQKKFIIDRIYRFYHRSNKFCTRLAKVEKDDLIAQPTTLVSKRSSSNYTGDPMYYHFTLDNFWQIGYDQRWASLHPYLCLINFRGVSLFLIGFEPAICKIIPT